MSLFGGAAKLENLGDGLDDPELLAELAAMEGSDDDDGPAAAPAGDTHERAPNRASFLPPCASRRPHALTDRPAAARRGR